MTLLNEKRHPRIQMEDHPTSPVKQQQYKNVKLRAQNKIQQIQNQWWLDKAKEIQNFANQRDMRSFYQSLNIVYGPRRSISSPLKSADDQIILKDEESILRRWTEHFYQLLNCPSSVNSNTLQYITQQDLHLELELPPTLEEVI